MSDAQRIARMHTAEHLLSAVMKAEYGCPAPLETHLGDRKSKCDYRVPGPLGCEEMARIETEVNRIISGGYRITCFELPRRQAETTFDLSRIPADLDSVRIVSIEGIDKTPCSGRHAETTSQLGGFFVQSYEMRAPDLIRIRFRLEAPSV